MYNVNSSKSRGSTVQVPSWETSFFKQTAAPGGKVSRHYIAVATHSHLAGIWDTGAIPVSRITAADGGPDEFHNKEKGFVLVIHKSEPDRSGETNRIDVSGKFKSKDGTKFSISRRWLDCKKKDKK